MEGCLFCAIASKKIPAQIVYEDTEVIVFPDIKPKARIHLLVVPIGHIKSFLDIPNKQFATLTNLAKVVKTLIREQKIEGGYQLIFNGGKHQHVMHLHWHLLGD